MMRRTGFILLVLGVLLSVAPALLAQPDTPERTLNVIDVSPTAAGEVAPDATITLYFDAPLDCATAETAATASAAGDFACDGATLAFTPREPLAEGSVLTLTIADTLRAADGAPFGEPYALALAVRGFLEVTATVPTADARQVEPASEVTVTFNRPVVALTTLDGQADLPQPLTFDPPVAGAGVWIGTSVYQFVPDTQLAGGTEYTVTVAGVAAVDGAELAEPHVFSFRTRNPEVIGFIPEAESSDVPLSQAIQVTFNQAMNRATTEEAFFLFIQEVPDELAGTFVWNDDDTGFMFTPQALTLQTAYSYGFAPDVALNAAETETLAPFSVNFYTPDFPAIIKTYPADGMQDVPPYDGVIVTFASRMNPETLADRIVIDPAPASTDAYFNTYSNEYEVRFPLAGETAYTVEILSGMEDVYGNTIDEGLVFSFTTGSKSPEISLNVPYNGIGIYDAGREDTVLYLTHMNVPQVDFELYRVPTQRLVDVLGSNEYYNAVDLLSAAADLSPVRAWTVDGGELNSVRRLQLVDVGDPAGAMTTVNGVSVASCAGAPESRVQVGDRARIITDPTPVRARSAPVSGEIIELMYRDYEFGIVGGPDCRDGVVWWGIMLRGGETAWVAEAAGGEYFFEVTQAAQVSTVDIAPLSPEGGPLPTGVYLLKASAPDSDGTTMSVEHVMVVSDTALLVKRGVERTLVWATDLHTGVPVEGADIQLMMTDVAPLTATTDADGVAIFEHGRHADLYARAVAHVDDGTRTGITSLDWSAGLMGYYFDIPVNTEPSAYRLYAYTDRPVYRPGQPVHYRGVVRARSDNDYTLPDFDNVILTVYNSDYETVTVTTLPLSEAGTFEGTLTLDAAAPLGYWVLEVSLPVTDGNPYLNRESVSFDVAEYRLPEFQVSVAARADEVLQGETIVADIDTTYFFGGPVANAEVEYYVTRENHAFAYQGDGAYRFYWNDEDAAESFSVRSYNPQTGTADAAGRLTVELPAETGAGQRSLTYTIEASARDESGQTVSGRAQVVVHQGGFYIGLAPREYVGLAGQDMTVDVITVDWESAPVAVSGLSYTVYEMRWNSVQELSPYSAEIVWRSELEKIEIETGTLETGADGRTAISFVPSAGGSYQIVVTGLDAGGNRAISAETVWVSGEDYVLWPQTNATAIQLVTDRTHYAVGDTAEILIPSPFMGPVEALVTLERDGVLRSERLTLHSNSTVYRLPIEEDFAPNVYLSVALIKGVDEHHDVADMRVGYATLRVDNAHYALNIAIETDTPLAGPRDTVTYTFTATDHTGQPVRAALGAALTDAASLSLGVAARNILDVFYGEEPLALMMASGMVINTDLITAFTRDVFKGGGGGGGPETGIIELRDQFIDTAFWDGMLMTDTDGRASVTLTLPDNLTTWRMTVRGVTDGADGPMLAGEASADLVATKPLIVRPVAPRFMTRGDIVTLGAVVNNNTPEDLTTEVSLTAEGVAISEAATQTVTIPAQGTVRVNWTASVGTEAEAVELIFSAQAGPYSDATRPAFGQGDSRLLPVYAYEVPEYVGTGGVLRTASARVEAVVLPQRYPVSDGTLTLALEPSLAVTALNAIEALDGVACECVETVASRLLANVSGLRALKALGLEDDPRVADLTAEANLGIQRLAAQQRVDGGWGWFSTLASDPLVSAWAVIALREAALDLTVDSGVIADGVDYLAAHLRTGTRSTGVGQLNRAAIVTYALAKANHAGIGASISNLYDVRDTLGVYAKALLLDAILMTQPDDAVRVNTLRDELLNAVAQTANGAQWQEDHADYFNWNSNTRTTAIVLRTLIHNDMAEPVLPNAVRWLMIARRGDMWETTQETAWALLALTDWMRATGETEPDFTYDVTLNGEEVGGRVLTPADAARQEVIVRDVATLAADAPNLLRIAREAGDGALYYTAYLNAYLPVPEIGPVSNGLSLTRTYRTLADGTPVSEARVGEMVEVGVTLIVPNPLNFVVIEDALPAGLEAINPDLNTAQQTGTQASLERERADGSPYPVWWADVRYHDEKIVLSADYVPAGTYEFRYLVRATVEGTYNVIPTTGRQFYLPEVYGRGSGDLFTVLPADE